MSEGLKPDSLTVSWGFSSTWVIATHLVNIDGEINGDVYQVSKGEAGDEGVRSVSHVLVLVDNPQQGDVANDPHGKNEAGQDRVDVLEHHLYGGGPHASGEHPGLRGVGEAMRRLPLKSVLQIVFGPFLLTGRQGLVQRLLRHTGLSVRDPDEALEPRAESGVSVGRTGKVGRQLV